MSVPEMDSAQAAGRAEAAATAEAAGPAEATGATGPAEATGAAGPAEATAAAEKADPLSDPRLPWHGKPRTADILCWLGIVLSGVFYWALLPLRVSLIGTHPVVAELLNGSTA